MNPEEWTEAVIKGFQAAQELAQEQNHIEITPAHFAMVLFEPDSLGARIAEKAQVELKSLKFGIQGLLSKLTRQDPPPSDMRPNGQVVKLFTKAKQLKAKNKDSFVAVEHVLLALYEIQDVSRVLTSAGLTREKVEAAIKSVKGSRPVTSRSAEATYDALEKYGHNLVKDAQDGKLDPVIGRDDEIRRVIQVLSRRTKNNPVLIGEPGVGKTAIVEGLAQRIVRGDVPDNLNCQVISLDMGALIAGASHRGEFEERLKAVLKEVKEAAGGIVLFIDEIHLVLGAGQTSGAMDAANLLKPMLARGELRCIGATTIDEYRKHIEKDPAFERRFQQVMVREPTVTDAISILRGLKERYENHHGVRIQDAALVIAAQLSDRYITNRFLPDKAIDLVDEACASVRVQLDSQPEVIDQLERRELQLDVEATALGEEKDDASKQRLKAVKEELAQIREKLKPLVLQHQSEKKRVEELRELKQKLEKITQKMQKAERERDLALAADLKYGAIPDLEKKIAAMGVEIQKENEKNENRLLTETVGPEQVAEIVSRWTGIPVHRLSQSERQRLLKLNEQLHRRMVGQDEAVDAVADAVLRTRAGLARKNQPTGSFLFLGPTGVGKTELAKALAEELFDDEKNLTRLDMSEYMEQHAVARLIGAPPGYVGYDEGGQLTEAVRRRPYSVVLFDEVEKAHHSIWNVMLQVLDDGRLTDGKGRTVDFTNTIIIMTSNIGATYLLEGIDVKSGKLREGIKEKVLDEVKKHFRPEFLNRLDDIVTFAPLSYQDLSKIIVLQLNSLAKRLDDKDVVIEIHENAAKLILDRAYDPLYGARPLKRYLEKMIVTKLSRMIIAGTLQNSTKVVISVKDGELDFSTVPMKPRDQREEKGRTSPASKSKEEPSTKRQRVELVSDGPTSPSSESPKEKTKSKAVPKKSTATTTAKKTTRPTSSKTTRSRTDEEEEGMEMD